MRIGIGLSVAKASAASGVSLQLVDSAVSASDLSSYTFSGRTLGNGLIIVAGTWRAASAVTLSSITVAGAAATVAVTSVNAATSTFIAYIVNTASTGDIVMNLSGAAARAGIAVYKANGYTQAAPYLTGTANRTSTAGTQTPNITGSIVKGFVIGVAFNGMNPGHRISTASKIVGDQTNFSVTADCQSGVTTWTAMDAGVDVKMEDSGVASVMSSCSAAFK